jgi:hypothetical protein
MEAGILVAACCCALAAVDRQQFEPGLYATSDGALVIDAGGKYVESYFSTKALLASQDAGIDVSHAARAWINWVLPRQRRDGRIDRFCQKADGTWKSCAEADADDSMLALWLQLLYRESPDSGLPAAWRQSAENSRKYLESLRNRRLGIYHVSRNNHVGLFMDNVEVYCSLKDIAVAERRFGESEQASRTEAEANRLARSIERIFWDRKRQLFRTSTQKREKYQFYPDAVAQTYGFSGDLPADSNHQQAWLSWRARYGQSWLARKYDPHPWGLIALSAIHMGDSSSAVCWLSRAAPLRYSPVWNILEEAVFQGLQSRLHSAVSAEACARISDNP